MPSPPSRIAFSLFGLDIMWYGILITAAIVIAAIIICYRAPRHGLTVELMFDYALWVIIAGIIGARAYYVLFNLGEYTEHPLDIFNLRLGGLAIHGALILGFATALVLCHRWRVRPLNLFDLAAPAIALAQAIGRWGNYFNQEAHGGPTDLPWAILVDGQHVHPTFLYESIWCVILFVVLSYIDSKRRFEGQVFLLYCFLYSIERWFVEGLRTDSLMLFGTLRQAQVLSAIVCGASLGAYTYLSKRNAKRQLF